MVNKATLDLIASKLVKIITWSIVLFLAIPIFLVLSMAFDPREYIAYFPPTGFTLHWFRVFLDDYLFREGLKSSIRIGIFVTGVALAVGVPCAFGLTRGEFRGKEIINTIILSPIIVPGVVTGSALVTVFYSVLHIYNSTFNLVVGHTIITIPYVVRTVSASLIGFDRSLEEAAQSLGANEVQTLTQVTLPVIKPGIFAAIVFAFATSWGDVAVAAFLSGPRSFTFPVAMMGFLRYNFNNTVAAASCFLAIVTVIIVVLVEKTVGLEKFTGLW